MKAYAVIFGEQYINDLIDLLNSGNYMSVEGNRD